MSGIGKYNKALVAFVTSTAALLTAVLPDGITTQEWVTLVSGVLIGTIGVFAVTNTPVESVSVQLTTAEGESPAEPVTVTAGDIADPSLFDDTEGKHAEDE